MAYLTIVILVFLSYCLISLVDIKQVGNEFYHRINPGDKRTIIYLSILFLILFVTFRPDTMPDYKSYIDDFKNLDKYRDLSMEIGDKILIKFAYLFSDNPVFVFFTFALIGIPLKVLGLRQMAPFFYLSMAVFVTGILIAQDMVAIRSSVAVGFFIWAVKYKLERKYWHCFLFSLLSILFHYSAVIIVIPICVFSIEKPHKLFYAIIIPAAYTLVLLGYGITQFFDSIHIEKFQQLWAYYKYYDEEDAYNIFNLFILGKCVMFYIILSRIDKIKHYYPAAILLLKIYCLSLVSTILLYESQSMAIRVGEFLGAVEVLLIPSILFSYKRKKWFVGYGICLVYCMGLLLCYGRFFLSNS